MIRRSMAKRTATDAIVCAVAFTLTACNDQFDFDTGAIDGQVDFDTGSVDGQAGDAATHSDAPSEAARPAGRIACGATTCVLPVRACCARSAGYFCIEVAEVD